MKRLLVLAVVAGALATLIGLGLWQLDRRAWKLDLIADLDANLAAPPIVMTTAPSPDDAWRRASFTGVWATKTPARIVSRTLNGQVGADFAAPLMLKNGDVIIVRIGWIRDPTETPVLPAGDVTVSGVLFPSPRPTAFTPDNTPPDRWLWLDPKPIATAFGASAERTASLALNVTDASAGLTARPARPTVPNDHLQYAFTWFSLALALAVIAFVALRRRR
ncbi:SURF1 family protein [Alphaproteobacteria bacterium]|nr:SURF1 family protein [Alphaproteobacteria bacterium]